MYTIDTSTIWQCLSSFFALVGGALRLDPNVFRAVQTSPGANLLTLLILLLAGVSLSLGQCVILFANKVTPLRFLMSLLLNGVLFAVGVFIWAAIFLLAGRIIFQVQLPFDQVGREVCLAYAPLLLGIFVLLPYAGSFLKHAFEIWSFLAILVATSVTLHLDLWQALLSTILGWVAMQVLHYAIGRPVDAARNWLLQEAAGTPLAQHVEEIVAVSSRNTTNETKGGR